jgi:hypothetical protein
MAVFSVWHAGTKKPMRALGAAVMDAVDRVDAKQKKMEEMKDQQRDRRTGLVSMANLSCTGQWGSCYASKRATF